MGKGGDSATGDTAASVKNRELDGSSSIKIGSSIMKAGSSYTSGHSPS